MRLCFLYQQVQQNLPPIPSYVNTVNFSDVPFPKSFLPLCRKILTRLFRVFVHVYIHHFDRIVNIGAVSIRHT